MIDEVMDVGDRTMGADGGGPLREIGRAGCGDGKACARLQPYTVSIPRTRPGATWLALGVLRAVHPCLGERAARFEDMAHYDRDGHRPDGAGTAGGGEQCAMVAG